jgi:hypothetical protein
MTTLEFYENIEKFYCAMVFESVKEEWHSYYNNCINLLMNDMGMQYQYG